MIKKFQNYTAQDGTQVTSSTWDQYRVSCDQQPRFLNK